MKNFFLSLLLCSTVMTSAQIEILPEILANREVAKENYLPGFSYAGYHYSETRIEASDGSSARLVGIHSDIPFDDYFIMDGRLLERSKNAIQRGQKDYMPAYYKLLEDAEDAMLGSLPSVMDKEFMPPSGTKHDYMSIGPYWWPDPDSPDGLPYINKDGLTNPEREKYDRVPMANMTERVQTLSLAYYFSREEKYADMAVQLITTWFLDPETRMNPHLLYGQAIKGRVTGRDIGIIDSRRLSDIPDAMRLIRESEAYSYSFEVEMKSWFEDFLDWLWNHPYGQGERNNKNNHGTAYDVQTTILALYTGRMDLAKTILSEVPVKRIDTQIKQDGKQPLELVRTKSYSYTVGNLMHFVNLSLLANKLNIDLINHAGLDGQSVLKALEYVMQYSGKKEQWPYGQIAPFEPTYKSFYEVLLKAYMLTNDDDYLEAADGLPLKDKMKLRANLLFPLVPDFNID